MRSAHGKKSLKSKVGWKKVQSQGRMARQVRLGVVALAFLLTLILVGKTIAFLGSLSRPYSPDGVAAERQVNWSAPETLNLAVKYNDIYLLSLNPQSDQLTIFKVPSEAYVNASFGFGSWPIRSIYGLGQGENPPMGAKLLETTLSSVLGVSVDGYLILPDDKAGNLENLTVKIKQNPLTFMGLLRKSKTDLSLSEYWNFWWSLKKVRTDKIETVDLGDSGIAKTNVLADGSKVYSLDQYKLDAVIQKQLEDLNLRKESLSVGVFNATDHQGLAEKAARIVTNMGGRVIFTTNLSTSLENSFVVERHQANKGKLSYTTSRLTKIFTSSACSKGGSIFSFKSQGKEPVCSPKDLTLSPSTADVNIILGEDYYLRYNKGRE